MGNSKSKNEIHENINIRRKYHGSPLLKKKLCESQHSFNTEDCRVFWVEVNQREHIPFVVLDTETKEDAEILVCRLLNCYGDRYVGSFVSRVEIEDWDNLEDDDFLRIKKTWRDDIFILCNPQVF